MNRKIPFALGRGSYRYYGCGPYWQRDGQEARRLSSTSDVSVR